MTRINRPSRRRSALGVIVGLAVLTVGCGGDGAAESTSAGSTTTDTAPSTIASPPPTPATPAPATSAPSTAPAPAPQRTPRRVALFGDSMLEFGLELYRSALTNAGHRVVIDAAQAGARLSDAYDGEVWTRARPAAVLGAGPEVLVVSFGINDAAGPYDVTRSLIDRLLADARRSDVRCVVWQTWRSPATFFGDAVMGDRLRQTWRDLRALDVDRDDLVLNDLGAQLDAGATGLLAPDGLHLSEEGTIANAVALVEAIDRCPTG